MLELAAGGVDVAASRSAGEGGNSAVDQHSMEDGNVRRGWLAVVDPRPWIPHDQIHLSLHPGEQCQNLARVLRLVVHSAPLVANAETMAALARGDDPRTSAASWTSALAEFKERRAQFLLYP